MGSVRLEMCVKARKEARMAEWKDTVEVVNPKRLKVDSLPAQRVPVGSSGDYKPCVALLPDGKLLLTAFRTTEVGGTRNIRGHKVPLVRTDILLFRSLDGGLTWSGHEVLDLPGREPYLTVLSDGTVLMTVHHLIQDIRNDAGYVQTYLHRSTDGGRTWTTIRFPGEDLPGWRSGWNTCSSRNVLELRDGSLVLGVGTEGKVNYLYRSYDKGATWERAEKCRFDVYEGMEEELNSPVWGEAVFWEAGNGDLLAIHRGDCRELPPIPGTERPDGHWDHHDRMVLFRSSDGRFWRYSELGSYYGEMYPAILRLRDGRLLLTFTVRDLRPPLGVRAVLGEETSDGFAFDFEHDRLMLDTKTPMDRESGGGFGRTVQLEDGTLITSYSYMGEDDTTHCEVVRWRLP